ncbi:MAG: hypothetical protein IT368_08475 [Candidatus Hydrogenedentes bacterium]|nr:hypothetical protein [Candidatus Hydrogenedentota bacterium]
MDNKEAIDLLEKQIKILEQAGIDMSGDRTFFYVGEYDLALEGVYVANKKYPGVLNAQEVRRVSDLLCIGDPVHAS